MIERCTTIAQRGWLELRQALWSDCPAAEHEAEMAAAVAASMSLAAYVAYEPTGEPIGLVEAAVRCDYVNGTNSTPVGFLEGLYVVPSSRRAGIARALVAAVEQWAFSVGCREMASDALLANTDAHVMHQGLGYEETERVVFFRKVLREGASWCRDEAPGNFLPARYG
jgi:aminoglycoside 6'-N-acetyltransferase I